MKKAILDKEISYLGIDSKIVKNLNDNNIMKVNELWVLKRTDLKGMGLSDKEINDVIIKLQLNAMDLGKKKY